MLSFLLFNLQLFRQGPDIYIPLLVFLLRSR